MGVHFTPRERSAMHRLLSDNSRDIVLKTDCGGFILEAALAIERLDDPLTGRLIGRNLFDLVHPGWQEAVRADHATAIRERRDQARIELPMLISEHRERWFELQLSCVFDEDGEVYGTVGIMRNIEERRVLEDKLFAAAMTDPLTGLTNRRAFVAMLQHLVDRRYDGCVAMFEIDHFKTINMRHGQAMGDEVLIVFGELLRTLMRSEDIVSRIGGQTLGVLLPRVSPTQAQTICTRVIETLGDVRNTSSAGTFCITASAGLTSLAGSLDETMKRCELALFMAKAKGRNRLETDTGPRFAWLSDQRVA
jgi:diguanylate cyclase (GGDEF)-like protein/PAS domain S-box-containing protein